MSLPLPPPSTASASASAVACGNCYSDDRWILHNVRHRGLDKKLCTSCVLKLHPAAFCPTCFSLHDPNSLNPILPSSSSTSSVSGVGGKTLTCFKCSSLSHSTCVPPNAPKSPYLCPPCSNPNFKFFDLRKPAKVPEDDRKVLDERSAKVLLAAARIATISMNKAVALARVDVERKVKEAALARKRAKEAIDHVTVLSARYAGNKRRETPAPAAIEAPVSAPAMPTATTGSKGPNAVPVKVEKKNNVAAPPAAAVHLAEKSNGNQLKVEY